MEPPRPLTLLGAVRENMRLHHYSLRTEKAYIGWIRRYVRFCGGRHPRELGADAVTTFLTHLAVNMKVSASTQNQALQSLLFLYREVLRLNLPFLDNVVRASRPARLPVVLTAEEVRRVLVQLSGRSRLVVGLLYGSGLRLSEALDLRVKDVCLERRELIVRQGKGGKDRMTVIPAALLPPLQRHLADLAAWFQRERRAGSPGVSLPGALKRKHPQAPVTLGWQWVFPSHSFCGGHRAAGWLPHLPPLLCHAPAGIGQRHPHGPGAAGPCGCENHDDLHSCAEPGRAVVITRARGT